MKVVSSGSAETSVPIQQSHCEWFWSFEELVLPDGVNGKTRGEKSKKAMDDVTRRADICRGTVASKFGFHSAVHAWKLR